MLHGLEARARELNRLAAENARKVADSAGRRVVVAGSVGPTGDLIAPLGPLSEDEAVDVFVEQIEGLREGGADVAWIETMSAAEEIRAAALAAAKMRHAVHDHRQLRHRRPHDDGRRARRASARLSKPSIRRRIAYGANCGVGASDLLVAILAMSAARPDAPLIAKANAGVPQWHGAHIHYSGTPELMATYAGLAVDCGARIIGGCCGNTPAHVAAMRRGLDAHRARRASGRGGDRRRARGARGPARRGGGRTDPPARARHERQGQTPRLERRRRARTATRRPRRRPPALGRAVRAAGFRGRRGGRGRAARPFPGPARRPRGALRCRAPGSRR